jgi:hypothetical protein
VAREGGGGKVEVDDVVVVEEVEVNVDVVVEEEVEVNVDVVVVHAHAITRSITRRPRRGVAGMPS